MIKKNEISYLFIGPSSYAIQLDLPSNMKVMPPAKRGDIENLMAEYPPGTVVLVDGTYHSYPAVSHAEIRTAIEAGWTFWGLSSMGAIRAVELAPVGMKGMVKCIVCSPVMMIFLMIMLHLSMVMKHLTYQLVNLWSI